MCGILITKGIGDKAHTGMAKYIGNRGIDLSEKNIGELTISHSRLALQSNSQPQPIKDSVGNYLYLIGEDYEEYDDENTSSVGEIENLYARLWHTKNWYFDWEGSLLSIQESGIQIFIDPLRKRPLFYYSDPQRKIFIISSDFKVFMELRFPIDDPINENYMGIIQRQGFTYNNETPINGVTILKPGETLITNYGYIVFNKPPPKVPIIKEEVVKLSYLLEIEIEKAVYNRIRRRTQSKSFGILLSGGTDSTYLASIIGNLIQKKKLNYDSINAICLIDLCNTEERNNISNLLRRYPIFKFITRNFYPNYISYNDMIRYFGFPVDLGSVAPQIAMSDAIPGLRKNDRDLYVFLTGDGADEFFGGYKRNQLYDSRYYDIFTELIHYHNIRLDQIPFNNTIELRTPFQALPLLKYVLGMPYKERKNKSLFRALANNWTKKSPLKIEDEDKITKRIKLIEAFRSLNGSIYD